MLFSSPFFLFVFLPLFFGLYWFSWFRRGMLLLGSMCFYAWSEPVFIWVVLASSLADWGMGWKIARGGRAARWWLAAGVASNLSLLVYAKYTVFGLHNLNSMLAALGLGAHAFAVPAIFLPLGVSFIVFEKITYLVDIHRKAAPQARSLLDYLNYVFLFPKLLAGPIVKYHDIDQQLARPSHNYEDVRDGLLRFLRGLGKKVLIADSLAPVVDGAFGQPAASLDPATAWLGLICFAFQIYFDFSGYSDMAIGLARVLGFRLMENFNNPYLATSFTDFWRRWHISLSTWIKEYLYIPLGGDRVSRARSYANLCFCFFVSGLWHGAAWNFVIWGCFHGLMLVADRAFWLGCSQRLPRAANIALTFLLVTLGWVFFRCESIPHALYFFKALFGAPALRCNDVFLYPDTMLVLLVALILVVSPVWTGKNSRSLSGLQAAPARPWALAGGAILLILCTAQVMAGSLNPFLYFRF